MTATIPLKNLLLTVQPDPQVVFHLRTSRAKVAARRLLNNSRPSPYAPIDKTTQNAFDVLIAFLNAKTAMYAEISKQHPLPKGMEMYSTLNFPGAPTVFDLSDYGAFYKWVFRVLTAYDETIAALETVWLRRLIPYDEHAKVISQLDGRIYTGFARFAKRNNIDLWK